MDGDESSEFIVQEDEEWPAVGVEPVEREIGVSKGAVGLQVDILKLTEVMDIQLKETGEDGLLSLPCRNYLNAHEEEASCPASRADRRA